MVGLITGIICGLVVLALCFFVGLFVYNPFANSYPYFRRTIDISRKRKPDRQAYVKAYALKHWDEIEKRRAYVERWKKSAQQQLRDTPSWLYGHRQLQYESAIDDEHLFRFTFIRQRTAYKQVNYVRHPYTIEVGDGVVICSYDELAHWCGKDKKKKFQKAALVDVSIFERERLDASFGDEACERIFALTIPIGIGLSLDEFKDAYADPDNRFSDFTGIYIIFNASTGMPYVGQAKNVLKRVNTHVTGGRGGNPGVHEAVERGDVLFIKAVALSDSGYTNLDVLEREAIAAYDACDNGYNKQAGNRPHGRKA